MSRADENWRVTALAGLPNDCAALAVTNRLLLEAVQFMQQNSKVLVKHREQLGEHGGRLTVLAQAQRLAEKRLDKHHDRLITQRKRLDTIDKQVELLIRVQTTHAACIDSHRKRLDALEQGRQTGMSAPPETEKPEPITVLEPGLRIPPEPIGQAWVFWAVDQFWWDTLEPGGDMAASVGCYTRAVKLFEPATPPIGSTVLVNLVRVHPNREGPFA